MIYGYRPQTSLESGSGELFMDTTVDGAVELYYDDAKKLETTATGVTVTGLLSATTKSFDIPHPTQDGMRLRYGSLRGRRTASMCGQANRLVCNRTARALVGVG